MVLVMDSLPFRLLEEILFKLDPKSLAMMQCTKRSMRSHISEDPYFISEYLSRIESLIDISTFGSSIFFCKHFGDSRFIRNKDSLEIKCYILASCSGLLLLFVDGLCVVNPLTKRFRFIGHSKSNHLRGIIGVPRPRLGDSRVSLRSSKMNHIGFSVNQIDRTTQRFKVVCIKERKASNPDDTKYEFEITTGDSCWRLSKTTITCSSSDLVEWKKPVYSDGYLYWLRNDGSILAFNPETEKARLIPIKFPIKLTLKFLFTAADNELAMISATDEVIYVYALANTLTDDPKWVMVKQIRNTVLDKERIRYWNVEAYDGKCLVVREVKEKGYEGVVHSYDFRVNKWEVIGSIPEWCDFHRAVYQFKPSFSSAVELIEKMDFNMMTKMDFDMMTKMNKNTKCISSLSKIMKLIGAQNCETLTNIVNV